MDNYTLERIIGGIIWLGFFTSVILSVYFYLRFRNGERMALIEKGIDVKEIFKPRDFSFRDLWFRLGLLALGAGTGIFVAFLIITLAPQSMVGYNQQRISIILMFSLLIFGGLGAVLGNYSDKFRNNKNG
jgi:hypothetical protein